MARLNPLLPFLILAALLFGVTGCGYKPSAHYAKAVVGERVSTEVIVSMKDPENTVIIKDAVETAVITRFKSSLTDKSRSDTHLRIRLKQVKFTPMQYDENGYIVVYRTIVTLEIGRMTGKSYRSYSVKGTYDFAIEPNAIISDQARFDAIRYGAQKAIDNFVARVAAEGVRTGE